MAGDPRPSGAVGQAGFTLVEALVALVVAGMVLAVFGRAMAGAWGSVKTPMDVVSGIILAKNAALGAPAEAFASAGARGFTIDRSSAPAEVLRRPSRLAPALVEGPQQTPKDKKSTPSGMQLAEPTGIVQSAAGAQRAELRHVSVVVATPLGRRLRFDTFKLDNVPP